MLIVSTIFNYFIYIYFIRNFTELNSIYKVYAIYSGHYKTIHFDYLAIFLQNLAVNLTLHGVAYHRLDSLRKPITFRMTNITLFKSSSIFHEFQKRAKLSQTT